MKDILRIRMSDGSEWDVPVMLIALDRAKHYAEEIGEFNGDIKRSFLEDTKPLFEEDLSEIFDWARNNMDWTDVKSFAKMTRDSNRNYNKDWLNGDMVLI